MMNVPKYPCEGCRHQRECKAEHKCKKWEHWFRHYWRALRRKYLVGTGGGK